MKFSIKIIIILVLCSAFAKAQVGINTTNPKAALDIRATANVEESGIMIPKLADFPSTITVDQDGILVFIDGSGSTTKGFYYYDAGNTIWIPIAGEASADNQQIDILNLNGTNLEISLQDDGVPTQTLNLSSLQDGTGTDNQAIDTFTFNSSSGILTLEMEDDGQIAQTVNLSSLAGTGGTDDQDLETPTLLGTTLNLNIEDGTGTSINLAPLQDGTGTDNQTIDGFNLNSSTGVISLELEDDGIAPQTVDISTIIGFGGTDNQNLVTPTLLGTTLNLNIENGTGTSIDLAPIQDGTGTDNQRIDSFFLSGNLLRLGLEDDGQPLQSVNLSSLSPSAQNGLTKVGSTIELGGALTQDTEITFGTRDIRWNLDSTGDFIIQDDSSGHWILNDQGDEIIGGGSYWHQDNTAGALTAQLTSTADDATFDLLSGTNTRIRLRANGDSFFNGGKLAIGKTTATGHLEISAPSSELEPHIKIINEGNGFSRVHFADTNVSSGSFWALKSLLGSTTPTSDFALTYKTSATTEKDLIYANASGRVGINAAPAIDFHVFHRSGSNNAGFRLQNLTHGDYWSYYSHSGGDLWVYSSQSGNNQVGIFNGSSGAYSSTSDRRLKENFEDLHFSWNKFLKLKPLTYNYKTDVNASQTIGLIAQDVKKIYPELVTYNKEKDIYHMDYSATGVIAIKAIQEQQATISKLHKEIEILKLENNRLAELERRIAILEKSEILMNVPLSRGTFIKLFLY